jgi:mono/diheme cytochrome c family protein
MNKSILFGVALSGCLVLLPTAKAQNTSALTLGKETFELKCAPCHGTGPGDRGRAMLPGTDALRIKYQGKVPAALENRSDLRVPVLQQYLRHGTWSMPPFRKSELSDADISNIAAYLAESSKKRRLSK